MYLKWGDASSGTPPLLGGPEGASSAAIVCELLADKTVMVGDHAVVFGRVVGVREHRGHRREQAMALTYSNGEYILRRGSLVSYIR